ncbi:hypothetical protein [Halorubrum amylolyticum]|uniref:hypothetical protein n=1 Tax=Halorubrum amylolyticum TaxID=2508724 RepID=UPI001008A55A|nr:hypothetical protein [Halorubrum amylolyticum]
MTPLRMLDEEQLDLRVSHSSGPKWRRSEAVVEAFRASDVDVEEEETTLHDWIRPDSLDGFDWSESPLFLCARIWERTVVVTADEVRIYAEKRDA